MKNRFLSSFSSFQKKIISDPRPFFLLISFLCFAHWSWRKSGDILVDFGRELYVPWQITQGRNLGQDILCLHGPFSKYFNALLFSLFGTSLTTLLVFNLCLLWLMTWMLYRIFSVAGDRNNAAILCFAFLGLFGFAHHEKLSNYNFMTPYCHEAIHGTFFCVVVFYVLMKYWDDRRLKHLVPAGLALGLSFLTKPETALAAAGIVIFSSILLGIRRKSSKEMARFLSVIGLSAILALALFYLLLLTRMPPGPAFSLLGSAWKLDVLERPISHYFYKMVSGFDYPKKNLFYSLDAAAHFFAVLILIQIFVRKFHKDNRFEHFVFFSFAILVWLLSSCLISWWYLLLSLNVVSLFLFGFYGRKFAKNKNDKEAFIFLNWAFFSAFFLLKIVLRAQLNHYGFYLAFPATLLWAYFILHELPSSEHNEMSKWRLRLLLGVFLLGGFLYYILISNSFYSRRNYPVGEGKDRIYTFNERGAEFEKTRLRLKEIMLPKSTLAVLPEGELLNYLLRKKNPASFDHIAPIEMGAYGEDKILDSLKKSPPDFIALVHRNLKEYGIGFFGRDPRFGKQIMHWVMEHYETVEVIGNEPFISPKQFGIKILRRKSYDSKG